MHGAVEKTPVFLSRDFSLRAVRYVYGALNSWRMPPSQLMSSSLAKNNVSGLIPPIREIVKKNPLPGEAIAPPI